MAYGRGFVIIKSMADISHILKRIDAKKGDYRQYNFTQTENTAFKTFFDLAQEFENMEDFYALCVQIPRSFFGLRARLYAIGAGGLELVAGTDAKEGELRTPPPEDIRPSERPYYTDDDKFVLTIRGKEELMDQLPYRAEGDVLGILVIYPARNLGEHRELFFEKYANRIGYSTHNRFLAEKNVEHLNFIRTLVADIEHNVIVPNMIYKLFLRDLKAKISNSLEVEKLLRDYCKEEGIDPGDRICVAIEDLKEANRGLVQEFENIERHYRNMTLFLETLLRRGHFDQGRLILKSKPCRLEADVIRPQLDRYREKFQAMGISVDVSASGIPSQEIAAVVDVGLMAQVYANLFANVVKYARVVTTPEGEKKKYMSYGQELIKDYFGPGLDGVKFNVFSTGPPIEPAERDKLFLEGFRGKNATRVSGTGHGLTFVKNVVELHGGVVGYEPTELGNNFYFILPKKRPEP